MPNLDGTGPEGKGPMTGRKRGLSRIKKNTEQLNDLSENEMPDSTENERGFAGNFREGRKFRRRRRILRRGNRYDR